jgi:putative nucleotidyltransferase with HDIG domain
MSDHQSEMVDVNRLRKGMFIQLDLGWMSHPFPLSRFRISSDDQIRTLVSLGVQQVRHYPAHSEPPPGEPPSVSAEPGDPGSGAAGAARSATEDDPARAAVRRKQAHAMALAAQRDSLRKCEQRYLRASQHFRDIVGQVPTQPRDASQQSAELVRQCIAEILEAQSNGVIRLMSEAAGERSAQHSLNVMTIALLLGRALGMAPDELFDLGQAALLHDIGKQGLPDRMRHPTEHFLMHEHRLYQSHVQLGVEAAGRMGLSRRTIEAIAQHHEMVDGSGFPLRLRGGEQIELAGKVIALVNRYDNLCNPARGAPTLTPHEALSTIFSQMKSRFDGRVLAAFVRMMGVYPPGSLVRLSDERLAMVVSVNPARPLRPRVLVHDTSLPREQALLLNLETEPELGITRSLRATQLPQPALHYLMPQQRVSYFFERTSGAEDDAQSEGPA